MPTRTGKDGKGCYARWGSQAKYYYECGNEDEKDRAKKKADKQGQAIRISQTKNSEMKNKIQQYQYIKNINELENEATILLYQPIGLQKDELGNMIGIDGEQFALEMRFLETQVEKINIRINSEGGRISDGYSIISSIKSSKANVCTYNDGMAASIAALILVAGNERYCMDYALTFIHNPFDETGDTSENNELLIKLKDSLITLLKNNTIYSSEELDKLMNDQTFFNAEEALKYGLVDEIITSGHMKNEIEEEIDGQEFKQLTTIFNKLISTEKMAKVILNKKKETETPDQTSLDKAAETKTTSDNKKSESKSKESDVNPTSGEESKENSNEEAQKEHQGQDPETSSVQNKFMSKIADALGCDEDMDDEGIYDAFKSHMDDHAKLKSEHAEMSDKMHALADEAKKAHKEKITHMVNSLIADGKIQPSAKESTTRIFTLDFDSAKNMFDSLSYKQTPTKEKFNSLSRISQQIEKPAENISSWKLEDYWRKDPKGVKLTELKNNSPAAYNLLQEDYATRQKEKSRK